MKAVVSKNDLVTGMSRVAGALPQRPSAMQILQNIHLAFDGDAKALRATATDLEVAAIAEIPATISEAGKITVPGKKFLESLRQLPEDEVTLIVTDRHALTLKCGKARLTIRGSNAEEYPALPIKSDAKGTLSFEIPDGISFEVAASEWKEVIRQGIIAASHDEARTYLSGANLVVKGTDGELVTTDGHRLAVCGYTVSGTADDAAVNVVVPLRVLSDISSNISGEGVVRVEVGDTQIAFTTEAGAYYSRLIAEKFPDYNKIIPKSSNHRVEANRQTLLDAVRRVRPFASARTRTVMFSIKQDSVIVSAESPEVGEGRDEVEASVHGNDLDISFNGEYLLDGLRVMTGDEIIFETGAKLDPAVITTANDKHFRYILMPQRQ